MSQMMMVSFGMFYSAFLICLTNILYNLLAKHIGKPQNCTYFMIVSLLAVNAVCEIVKTHAMQGLSINGNSFNLLKIAQYCYFVTHTLIAPMLYFYISFVVGRSVNGRISWKYRGTLSNYLLDIVPVIMTGIAEFFVLLNPVLQCVWYYDEQQQMHRAWGEYVFVYGTSLLWIILTFVMLMRSWNILSKGRKYACAVCYLLVIAGIVTQLINKDMRVEVLMEALGFTGILVFVENEDDKMDAELGVYNAAAFALDLSCSISNHVPVQLIIVRSVHFNKTANTMVSGRVDKYTISSSVADYLCTRIPKHFIYSIGHGRFALALYKHSDEEVRKLAEEIMERFQQPWQMEGTEVYLSSTVMIVKIPDRARTVQEVQYIAECPIPEARRQKILEGDDLNWIVRHAAVEEAVTNGLRQGSFMVYYQPTYHIDRTLHGAEALLRMRDPEMGMIYPDEFIPVAEQLGLIDELDEFVLQEVCRFLATGIPDRAGMDCINVNLSVLECMKDGFAEHVSEIVERAGIPKDHINFEITESVAATDYAHLSGVISRLKAEGFLFSIDDFGTGFSNMMSIFSLGADVIKIDKSVLWGAERSEIGMVLLKASIGMVREMHKHSLVEGVETEEQIEILKRLGCTYLQGFYFSKPLPEEEFIRLIGQG